MKLFWVFLCLPLVYGVSVSKSEVGKQVRSKRDAETTTTPTETITVGDDSEDYEEEEEEADEEADEEEEKEDSSDVEKEEESDDNPDLTSEEVAYISSYLKYLRSNPQRSSHRFIAPVQPPYYVRRGKERYSGFERDSFEPRSGFRGPSDSEESFETYKHRSRLSKHNGRNSGESNSGRRGYNRGSERDDGHYRRRSHRRYGDNNDRDTEYTHRRRYGSRHHGHGGNLHRKRYHYDPKRDRNDKRRLWSSELTGPNGVKVNITDPPYSKKWHCPETATMILLKPNGRMGKVEYGLVKDLVEKAWTGSFGGSIQKVEKITNQCLWKKYRYRKTQISNYLGKTDVIETLLFYGGPAADLTAKTNEGFDERDLTLQSSDHGAAFDFTSSSSTANTKSTANGVGSKTMLLCRVALGNAKTMTSASRTAHAPVTFHSVKLGNNNAIYRGEQVYPEYLITYT